MNSHLVQKITTFLSCYFFMGVIFVISAHCNVVTNIKTYVIESTQVSCLFALSLLFMPHSSLNSCKNAGIFGPFWLIPAKRTSLNHTIRADVQQHSFFLPIGFYCIRTCFYRFDPFVCACGSRCKAFWCFALNPRPWMDIVYCQLRHAIQWFYG